MTSRSLARGSARADIEMASFWDRPALEVAPELVGFTFCVEGVGGVIVETEAYSDDDPASHSFAGQTRRNASMFGPAGHIYVYRSYGLHWCLNFVCRRGSAVLLRALEPVLGIDRMVARRGLDRPRLLCSGPGRLAMALGINESHDGLSLANPMFSLSPDVPTSRVTAGARIGISKAVDKNWRFGIADSPFISKRFKHST